MNKESFDAVMTATGASVEDGTIRLAEGQMLTLHLAHSGAQLSVTRVESIRLEGELVHAHDQKGQLHMFALEDLFAVNCSAPVEDAAGRSAGFRR